MYTDTYRFMFLELRSKRCANRCLKARLIVELDSGQLTEEGAVAGPAAYRRTLTRASRLLQRTRKSRAASPSPATERARDLRGAAPDLSLSTLSSQREEFPAVPISHATSLFSLGRCGLRITSALTHQIGLDECVD